MATTERSLGWATGVASTDGASTYDSSRMSAFERAGLGVGVLLTGSYLAMSGATTTTLTIADGTAIVGGYFYESNGIVTISTSTLGSGTFSVVIIANTAAGSQTVSANGAGTTTVLTATTRAVVVTAAQLSTITTSITATNIVTLGTIVLSSGTISSITPYYPFATNRTLAPAIYATMSGGSAGLTAANTDYQIGAFSSSSSSADGTIAMDSTTGTITLLTSGYYIFSVQVQYSSGTTGNRRVTMDNVIIYPPQSAALFATGSTFAATHSTYLSVTAGSSVATNVKAWSSVTGQTVTNCVVTVKRI
ncbi:MAG: hypothetical protein EBR82_69990 [Caulobacteraceae bacterium]|nr:hypothetical protein [Caulobacteraceae bacterium]